MVNNHRSSSGCHYQRYREQYGLGGISLPVGKVQALDQHAAGAKSDKKHHQPEDNGDFV